MGDAQTFREFWDRYGAHLHNLAAKNMETWLRRREGPEDVVQSVCRSFLRRAKAGQYELADTEALWRLLCAITLNKLREKKRFHGCKKRSPGRERQFDCGAGTSSTNHWDLPSRQPTPGETAEFSSGSSRA